MRRIPGTAGDGLEVENVVQPGFGPPMHVHHHQVEALTVVQGHIGYQRLGEEPRFAGPGESVTFAAGEAHRFWNAGEDELHCTGYVQPADNLEYFLGAIYDAQRASGGSRPGIFETAYLTRRFRSEFAMSEIPAAVQRFVFPVVATVGRGARQVPQVRRRAGGDRALSGAMTDAAPRSRRSSTLSCDDAYLVDSRTKRPICSIAERASGRKSAY